MKEEAILDRHLTHWRSRGLVTEELEGCLRAASAEVTAEASASVVRSVLGTLGSLLVLAGLMLVIGENWAAIPDSAKLGGFALVHGLLLAGADHFTRREPRPALGEGLSFAACGLVMAGIALVSQIYQLDSRPPNGVWLWLALLLPAPWLLRARSVAVALVIALGSALALEVGSRDSWLHTPHVDGPWLWLAIPWLAVVAGSFLPRPWNGLRDWVGTWTFVASQIVLLVFGAMQDLDRSDLGGAWWVAAPGVALALAFPRRVLPSAWEPATGRIYVAATLLPWLLLGGSYDASVVTDRVVLALTWLVQFGLCIAVVRSAARCRSRGWVNLGYVALLAGIVTRYFDFFENYLEGGTALAGTGLVLLATVFLIERSRRRTLGAEVAA